MSSILLTNDIIKNNLERKVIISSQIPTIPFEETKDNSRDPIYKLHLNFINLGEFRKPTCILNIFSSELDFTIKNFILMSIVYNQNFIPTTYDKNICNNKYDRLLNRMQEILVGLNGYSSEREQLTDLKLKLSTDKKLLVYYNPALYSNIKPFQFSKDSINNYLIDNHVNLEDNFNNLRQVNKLSQFKEIKIKMYSLVFMYEFYFGETSFGQKLNDV